ncbi:MAG: oligosaccharide flippase family protein [Methanomassiliicoccales archaeon]|nr:MAG: oligosaccharide flippase family protein [Methanomassiliicoccales archaeon]
MIKLVLTAIMVGAVLLGIFIWKFVVGRGFESYELEMVIYIFILYYAILSMNSVPYATFAARRETAKGTMPALMEPLTRVPLTIVIALGSFGVLALAGAYVAGVTTTFITAIILFRSYPFAKFDSETFKSYFKFALPIALASAIGVISLNIDKVYLQLFWGARFVGYYFTVQKLTAFLIFMSTSVTVLLFPTLSEHHGKNEYGEIRRLTLTAERYISLIIMPCIILLIVFSRPILNILQAEVAEQASTILQIMAIYALLISFYTIFINQIVAVDRPGLAVKIGLSVAAINISMNTILIPKDIKSIGITLFGLGGEGAALATTISIAWGLIICKIITRRLTGTKWNPRILLHMGASLVMGGILYYMNSVFSIVRWYELAGAGLIGIGIYIAFLSILREFTMNDLRLFLNILNPKEMKQYIVSELRDKEKKR